MLKLWIAGAVGFILGWVARHDITKQTAHTLNMDQIARQMREDYQRNQPHGEPESDGERSQKTFDG